MDQIQLIHRIAQKINSLSAFHTTHIGNSFFTYTQAQMGNISICTYNIHDTLEACACYLSEDGEVSLGWRYIKICGMLQSLFIQQDAINAMRQILLPELKPIKWMDDYPIIYEIREYRNRYFGHPTEGRQPFFHLGALMPTTTSLKQIRLLKMQPYKGVSNAMFTDEINLHEKIIEQLMFLDALLNQMNQQVQAKFN